MTRYTHLDNPIIIDCVKPATQQHVACFLENVEVHAVYQDGLDSYTYHANAQIGRDRYPLEACSNRFIDDPEELGLLYWMFPNGIQFPKMIALSQIEYRLEKMAEYNKSLVS